MFSFCFRQRRRALGASLFLMLPGIGASAWALDFDGAVRAALEQAPSLRAHAASEQAAAALQAGAGQLPDPKLSLGIGDFPVSGPNRGSLTRDNFTMRQIGYAQDVPNRARRLAQTDAAEARTAQARARLHIERQAVRREAGLAWLARHYALRRLALFDELTGHHQVLRETALAQLAAGKISAADLAGIELEALNLADRRDELRREAEQAAALLRRWAGTAALAPASGEAPRFAPQRADLLARLESNPEIAALTPMRALAEAELREAEAALGGDWGWSVGYGRRGQGFGDLVSAQLSFELPIAPGQRQQPQIRARQQEIARIDAERADLLRRTAQEIDTLLAEQAELAHKQQRLMQQMTPLAAQRSAYELAAYEGGRAALSAVQEARKHEAELRLRALDLQARQGAVQWRLQSIIAEDQPS